MTHKHEWLLNLSRSLPPLVFCKGCGAQFRPDNQQLPYKGKVPDKYAVLPMPQV